MPRPLLFGVMGLIMACGVASPTTPQEAEHGTLFASASPSAGPEAGTCVAPDVLFALDRTLTMHRTPAGLVPDDTPSGHATSKWALAIRAIQHVVAPPRDQGLRFGLELWPKQSPGCITLSQRIEGVAGANPTCEGPEVLVAPDLGTGNAITGSLDPDTTPICASTPTGNALLGAEAELAPRSAAGKRQFVVLVTDGADWDKSCPDPDPRTVVDRLSAAGISTVIVGFSAEAELKNGVGVEFLNDMACAGQTAVGFPGSCLKTTAGGWRALSGDESPVFHSASTADELAATLDAFSTGVCCDCVR